MPPLEDQVTIRPARPEDASAIARVHVTTWQVAYRGQVPDPLLDGLSVGGRERMWTDLLTSASSGHQVWVAERAGRIIGFAYFGPSRDEGDAGELYAMYVDPEAWHRGIGQALLARAVEELRASFPVATLWVLEGNERTRRFYEQAGWRADGSAKTELMGGHELREVRYRVEL